MDEKVFKSISWRYGKLKEILNVKIELSETTEYKFLDQCKAIFG